MRTVRIASLALALSALLVSTAARADSVQHVVSVGGPDQDPTAHTDANFSLVAIQYGDGSVSGQWTDQFGQGQGGVHVAVNCLSVAGNQAWIGGTITHGNVNGVDVTGVAVVTEVQDNGQSANDPPDTISFTFFNLGVTCDQQPQLPLVQLTSGQVNVR